MGIRTHALLDVVFAALPARADIVLSYHLSSFNGPATAVIPNNLPLGPQITDLSMAIGEVRYLQIAITANANAPQIVSGQHQANWTGTTGMIAFGFQFNYPVGLINQPYIPIQIPTLNQNLKNANAQIPFAVGHPNTFTGYNLGATAITGTDMGDGLQANAGILPTTVIATFRLVATAIGVSSFTITDLNSLPSAGGNGLLDGTSFDPFIFAPAHGNYALSLHVNAVPEPSSLAMAGCVAAAIGWRRVRRGNAAAKC